MLSRGEGEEGLLDIPFVRPTNAENFASTLCNARSQQFAQITPSSQRHALHMRQWTMDFCGHPQWVRSARKVWGAWIDDHSDRLTLWRSSDNSPVTN